MLSAPPPGPRCPSRAEHPHPGGAGTASPPAAGQKLYWASRARVFHCVGLHGVGTGEPPAKRGGSLMGHSVRAGCPETPSCVPSARCSAGEASLAVGSDLLFPFKFLPANGKRRRQQQLLLAGLRERFPVCQPSVGLTWSQKRGRAAAVCGGREGEHVAGAGTARWVPAPALCFPALQPLRQPEG